MIEGTKTQLDLMAWKKSNLKNFSTGDSFGSLGTGYWKIFFCCNADISSAKKAI
jgi:hypothetical protein